VKAVVVLRDSFAGAHEEIQAFAKARLSSYKTPAYIAFVDELPRNPMGKVLKTDLRRDHGGADNN
jgi:acyl-coenzyme A synthetase/AMP-(fatty) acid ligase